MRLLVIATCLAAAIPVTPALAVTAPCVAVAPGSPTCAFYTDGTFTGVCAATRCAISDPTGTLVITAGETVSYWTPPGTRITLTVDLGAGVLVT